MATPPSVADLLREQQEGTGDDRNLFLNRSPANYLNNVAAFCKELKRVAGTVSNVKLTSQFLLNLNSDAERFEIMRAIGELSVRELSVGAISAAPMLTETLKLSNQLLRLNFWKLKLSSTNQEMKNLCHALAACQSLQEISFSHIRFAVHGENRIINVQGQNKMYFHETENSKNEVSLDPLYEALASLPNLDTIRIRSQPFNESRILPPSERCLRLLCQPPRKALGFVDCGLLDDQCFIIADELKSNLALCKLSVILNLQIRSWQVFVDMLAVNYGIVDFQGADKGQANPPSDEQLAKIGHYIHLNRHGRGTVLTGSYSARRTAWFHFLTRGKDNLDLVFFAMQADPSLYCNTQR